MRTFALILSLGLAAGAAFAQEKTEKTPVPDAKPQMPGASETPAKPKPVEKPRAASMSQDAYARRVAAELRRHTPSASHHHPGSVKVTFTIGASGRVTSHKILHSSDPSLEATVANILASVHTPPPPGGSFSANQEFRFK